MWDKRVWRGELVIAANQMVTCKFEGINQALTWFLSAVYASCDPITRRELWQEFINIKELCNGPWVACGDFNATRYPNERSEGHGITTPMTEFSDWINEMEFIDPPLFGGSFTWRRGDNHMSASRIDRFLFSSQWDGTFTGIKQSILPRIGSDHSPILLECGDLNLKKSYFKFEQWWLRVEGFSDKVKDWWESFNITGTGSYVLASKLRMLKGKLKEWKRENRNNWNQRKEEILNQLSILEKTQELRLLSEDELLQKVHLSMEFEDVAKNEEIAWRQRSRVHWLKHGDKNTKFFHRMATAHKRFNTIDMLMVEGVTVTDSEEIKGTIINFYQNLYRESEQWRPDFNVQGAESITQEENVWLQRQFEEDEVFNCIKSCASDKAPGPDGFPMSFFQTFWEILKTDFMNATEEWVSNVVDSTYGVSVWRSIRNLWDSLMENLVVKVGEGNKIFFWKDKWIGQECLNSVFPDLFSFCTNPEAKIAEIWSPQGWNLTFRRNLNDWEVDRIAELLLKLGEFTGPTTEADGIRWKHNSDGKLSVSRLYKREIMAHSGGILGPWKQIWKGNIPTKVKCFTWLVIRRACLTQEKLKKRGFQIVSRCGAWFTASLKSPG
ncbi:hypothetical protein MTR67_006754 [Solanum verrucosum]|uniref:Reverse transcriptase zinc-binding domain-containing protein n=1 Tax=Solanum verrucosum TaxID=315347 RepID=A0AAF0Q4P6_SOLVR|nr:hypothetical protein MTR67_006754 [Solanum verrucosum]